MHYRIAFPLPRKKIGNDHQKHAGACRGRAQANSLEAPAQSYPEKVTYGYPEQNRGQYAVNQGKEGMASADEKTVNAEYKRYQEKIPGKRTEIHDPIPYHQGIVPEEPQD